MALPLTPLRCLERALALFPGKIGVICRDKQFTYEELGDRCGRLASALIALGVQPGDRVAYLSFNTHQLWEGYFGVLQAGAVLMPLNVRLSVPELGAILCHAEPAVLFYEADFAPAIPHLKAACPATRHFISLDDTAPDSASYESLLSEFPPAPLDSFTAQDEQMGELFYTSGSTGIPKGVVFTHRALYLHALSVVTTYLDAPVSVALHTIPLFHANAWGQLHAATMLGLTQVMVRRFDPVFVFRLIQQHRATDMSIIPLMGQALLNVPDPTQYDVSSMKQISIGGAASSPGLIERLERLFRCDVYSGYGLTESGPVLTLARLPFDKTGITDEERWRLQASTGWPVPGATLRVVDSQMRDVPKDGKTIGEIIASTDWLMSGYYKDPAGSDAILTGPNGEPGGIPTAPVWLHTGDMAVWQPGCNFTIVDRKKEIIVSGGENISSLEIEKAISSHPSVLECAVVAAPDDHWGEIPAAVVLCKPGQQLSETELLQHLGLSLARFKLPRSVRFVNEPLPKTGTGKVRKVELRESLWQGHEKRVHG